MAESPGTNPAAHRRRAQHGKHPLLAAGGVLTRRPIRVLVASVVGLVVGLVLWVLL